MKNFHMTIMHDNYYRNYMMCNNDAPYREEKIVIAAETEEEAIAIMKANYPKYNLLTGSVKTDEQLAQEAIEREESRKWWAEREAHKKAVKDARDARHAAEMGMTVAEYKTFQNRQTKCRKYHRDIAELKAQIAEMEAYIAKYEAK